MMGSPIGIRFTDKERTLISEYAQNHELSFSETVRQGVLRFIEATAIQRLSLAQVAAANPEEDITLLFSQFLDDFQHAEDKERLIEQEPIWQSDDPGRWYYDLAATAHKLAHDNEIPVPKWALKDSYVAPEPLYAFDTQDPEFRDHLEKTTPREFASHNLYLGENILSRR